MIDNIYNKERYHVGIKNALACAKIAYIIVVCYVTSLRVIQIQIFCYGFAPRTVLAGLRQNV